MTLALWLLIGIPVALVLLVVLAAIRVSGLISEDERQSGRPGQ